MAKFTVLEAARRADRFFMKKSPVHKAVRRIAAALDELDIPFAVVGCLAVNAHGLERMTVDVDILMTRAGLEQFKKRWLGRGWVEKFPGSKGLRDARHDVIVDVLLAGDYPGDGKEKPLAFPVPEGVAERNDEGLPILRLPLLLEMKIASGMTAPHRPRDFDDVIRLIRVNRLPKDYGEQLHPYVHEKFAELWEYAQVDEDY